MKELELAAGQLQKMTLHGFNGFVMEDMEWCTMLGKVDGNRKEKDGNRDHDHHEQEEQENRVRE